MRTHGLVTTARRGGPDGGKCDCPDCVPVRLEWERNRRRRYRNARGFGEHICSYCGTRRPTLTGIKVHEAAVHGMAQPR